MESYRFEGLSKSELVELAQEFSCILEEQSLKLAELSRSYCNNKLVLAELNALLVVCDED